MLILVLKALFCRYRLLPLKNPYMAESEWGNWVASVGQGGWARVA